MGDQPSKKCKQTANKLTEVIYGRIMTKFGEEMETEAILDAACASSPLGSVALGNIYLDQAAHLPLLIKPHFAMFTRIDDAGNIRDGDTSFRDVSRLCWGSV